MANLLQALQGQSQQQIAQPQGATDQTQGLATLLRAKSGKAGVRPATTLSSQLEQGATAAANQQLQPVAQQAQLQGQQQQQQSAGIEQQRQAQLTDIGQQRQMNTLQTQVRTNQMLQDLAQSKGKIDAQRYQAGLEQVGQNLRLQNQQYVDNLQREAARARLNDAVSFKEELQRSIFGDQQDLLQKQLGNRAILDANARQYSEALSQMGVDNSYQMFQAAMKNEQDRALWTGIAGVATAGTGAAAAYAGKSGTSSAGGTGASPTTTNVSGERETNINATNSDTSRAGYT